MNRLLSTGLDPLSLAAQEDADTDQMDVDGANRRESDQVYEQQSDLLRPGRNRGNDQLTIKFLQKYIHVARQLKPQLTKEAGSILAEKYCDLRAQEATEGFGRPGRGDQSRIRRTQPITARSLETLIRLATAHAKARMSKTVSKKDAEAAVQLLSFVLFKEVLEKPRKRDHTAADGHSDSEDEGHRVEPEGVQRPAKRKATETSVADPSDPYAFSEESERGTTQPSVTQATPGTSLSADRLRQLSTLVSRLFQERRVEQLPLQEVTSVILSQTDGFTRADVHTALEAMHADNRIMLTTDDVWLI
ncbi:unnamed protein product [Dicrocoelium dendriticum]|nr:unnamed protein product [Dicrocoelium dendriticum]